MSTGNINEVFRIKFIKVLHLFSIFGIKLTLSEQYVCHGAVDVVPGGVAGVDHEPIDKLHRFCPLTSQLSGYNHLATLCTTFHDETKYAIARSEMVKI